MTRTKELPQTAASYIQVKHLVSRPASYCCMKTPLKGLGCICKVHRDTEGDVGL